MPLYPQLSKDMVVGLINQANPSLPVPISSSNVKFGAPVVITPAAGSVNDTSLLLTAAAQSPFIGKQTVTYRRIDLSVLFRGTVPIIAKYTAAASNAVPFTLTQLLNDINANLGLNLTATDFVAASFPAASDNFFGDGTRTSQVALTAAATSLAYKGSFTIRWKQAPQVLSNVVTVTSLETARRYPSGDTVDATGTNTPYVVDLDAYSFDWTDAIAALATPTYLQNIAFNGNASPGVLAVHNAIINQLKANNPNAPYLQTTGANADATNPTQKGNLSGLIFVLVDLTVAANQAAYPEADFKYFNKAYIGTLPAANTWGAGRFILHYNG